MDTPRTLTCVYCGHQYPQDTPAAGAQILTDHIKVCDKHPMRQAEKTIKELREENTHLLAIATQASVVCLAGFRMLSGWSEGDDAVRARLWKDFHAANFKLLDVGDPQEKDVKNATDPV